MNCPYCGRKIKGKYIPYSTDTVLRTPLFLPSNFQSAGQSTLAAIFVPLSHTLTVTLLSGIFAGSLASVMQLPVPQMACAVGTALGLAQWVHSIRNFAKGSMIAKSEGEESDMPDVSSDPAERIILVHTPARHHQNNQLHVRRFVDFVRGCETNTAQNYWERIIPRDQYTQWRDILIKSGWARWRNQANPKQGWELVYPAEQIVRAVVEAPHSYLV